MKNFLLVLIFCAFNVAQTSAQIGSSIAEFELTVPADYNQDTQIDVFAKKIKPDKSIVEFSKDFTSANFLKATNRLIPGKIYVVKIFPVSTNGSSSESCLSFLKNQRAILVGAQGLTLIYELAKSKLPKDKWIVSFDQKESLWLDSSGNHGLPVLRTYPDGDYSFNIEYLEYDLLNGRCLLCFYEK